MNAELPTARDEGWEWWWECPECGEGHAEDFDIRSTTLTCPTCGERSYAGMSDDLPEAIDNDIRYKWACPNCDLINFEESDVRGSEVTCECGARSKVQP